MKIFFGLVKMTFGLVDVGYSLPDGQAVKLIFFAPCVSWKRTDQEKYYHDFTICLISDKSI